MVDRQRIFLAHAREDKRQVRDLHCRLKECGFDPWLDEFDLLPGQVWKNEIPRAIADAKVFLACLSRQSVSKVGYVQSEFRRALTTFSERPHGSIFLIPVRLDDCEIPDLCMPDLGVSFADIQWVDLFAEGGFDRVNHAISAALISPKVSDTTRSSAPQTHVPSFFVNSFNDISKFSRISSFPSKLIRIVLLFLMISAPVAYGLFFVFVKKDIKEDQSPTSSALSPGYNSHLKVSI